MYVSFNAIEPRKFDQHIDFCIRLFIQIAIFSRKSGHIQQNFHKIYRLLQALEVRKFHRSFPVTHLFIRESFQILLFK